MKYIPVILLVLLSVFATQVQAQTSGAAPSSIFVEGSTGSLYSNGLLTSQPYFNAHLKFDDESPRSGALLSLGGAAGFMVGVAAGTMVGYAINHETSDTHISPVTGEMLIGAFVGSMLGPPLGVHLVNRRGGNVGLSGLGSVAVSLAYIPLFLERLNPLFLTLPLAQIAMSVIIERVTTR